MFLIVLLLIRMIRGNNSQSNKRKCTQILSLNCYLEYHIVKKHKNLIDCHKWKYRVYSISKGPFQSQSEKRQNVEDQLTVASEFGF